MRSRSCAGGGEPGDGVHQHGEEGHDHDDGRLGGPVEAEPHDHDRRDADDRQGAETRLPIGRRPRCRKGTRSTRMATTVKPWRSRWCSRSAPTSGTSAGNLQRASAARRGCAPRSGSAAAEAPAGSQSRAQRSPTGSGSRYRRGAGPARQEENREGLRPSARGARRAARRRATRPPAAQAGQPEPATIRETSSRARAG